MTLPRACDYAVQSLAFLAGPSRRRFATPEQIAEAYELPLASVRSCLARLEAAGLVHSGKRRTGAYRLSRPARAISLLAIIEAVQGPFKAQPASAAAVFSPRDELRMANLA